MRKYLKVCQAEITLAGFLVSAILAGYFLSYLATPSAEAQFDGGAWRVAPVGGAVGGGFSPATPVDSITVINNAYITGRVLGDTLIVGPCASNPTWNPFVSGAPESPCLKVYASTLAVGADTLYVGTGWAAGALTNHHHIILGPPEGVASVSTSMSGIFIEPEGGQLGFGVRDPVRDAEFAASDIAFNQQANKITTFADWIIYSDPASNAQVWDLEVSNSTTSVTGSRTMFQIRTWSGPTSPNQGSQTTFLSKARTAGVTDETFWIDDEGHLVVNGQAANGTDHTQNRVYDATFPSANRADSTFEVNGGAEFNGGIAANFSVSVQDNILLGAGAVNGTDLGIVFSAGTSPTSSTVGTAHMWAENILGVTEIRVRDSGGTVSNVSANINADIPGLVRDEAQPYITYERNNYIGVETFIAKHKLALLVQELARREGLLEPEESIIVQRFFGPTEWEGEKPEWLKRAEAYRKTLDGRKAQ